MDKLIGLKSAHIGYCFAGLGFVALLVCLAFGGSVLLALHSMLGAFAVGGIAEGIASIVWYEKGVRNA
jgi:hypothetical protein